MGNGTRLKFPFYYCCAPQSKEASKPCKGRLEFSWAILQSCCFSFTELWGPFLSLQLSAARISISEICSTVRSTKSDCLYTPNDNLINKAAFMKNALPFKKEDQPKDYQLNFQELNWSLKIFLEELPWDWQHSLINSFIHIPIFSWGRWIDLQILEVLKVQENWPVYEFPSNMEYWNVHWWPHRAQHPWQGKPTPHAAGLRRSQSNNHSEGRAGLDLIWRNSFL